MENYKRGYHSAKRRKASQGQPNHSAAGRTPRSACPFSSGPDDNDNHGSRDAYKVRESIDPLYTGGPVSIIKDKDSEQKLALLTSAGLAIRSASTGKVLQRISLEEDEGVGWTFFCTDGSQVYAATSPTMTLERWTMATADMIDADNQILAMTKDKVWKGHGSGSPVIFMTHHPSMSLLATAAADRTIRVWDSVGGFCTHSLKASAAHSSTITALKFLGGKEKPHVWLLSASEDGLIVLWDLVKNKAVRSFNGHVSAITSMDVTADDKLLISASRDQSLHVWDIGSGESVKTIAALEPLETMIFARDGKRASEVLVFTAGEKGVVRQWNVLKNTCVKSSEQLTSSAHSITHLFDLDTELLAVTSDQILHFLDSETLVANRRMIGNAGEITDLAFTGKERQRLAMASNGPDIALFRGDDSMNVDLLRGHMEAVIALSASSDFIVSGSRDHTVRLWSSEGSQIAVGNGHTDAVAAVALPHKPGSRFVVSAGSDCTMKLWDIQPSGELQARWTVKAHDKDINSIAVAPNDRVIITGSQDKAAKLWSAENGALIAELRGHKRGVWAVAAAPLEPIFATCSADKSIKLWSGIEHDCIRTLEGHANSVLRIAFIENGTKIISAGSDGLLKVWDVRSGECLVTADEHNDRIWALAVRDDGREFVTGDALACLRKWRDVTEEEKELALEERNELIQREQELSNLLLKKDWPRAIAIAMELDQPSRLFGLFNEMLRTSMDLVPIIATFSNQSLSKLLVYLRDWNAGFKRAYVSQSVLAAIFRCQKLDELVKLPGVKETVEALLAYTERHLRRTTDLMTASYTVDFALSHFQ